MKGKEPTTLDDLSTLQPSLAAGLKKLLEYKETYDGEIQSVFDMRFEVHIIPFLYTTAAHSDSFTNIAMVVPIILLDFVRGVR